MAWFDVGVTCRVGLAWLGSTRLGSARLGLASFGSLRFGVARLGLWCVVCGFTKTKAQPQKNTVKPQKKRPNHKNGETTLERKTVDFSSATNGDLWVFHFDAPNSVLLDSVTLCCWLWLWPWLCALSWCCGGVVCPSKTSPCVGPRRLRVCRHHAHMLKHTCAWCRHTRRRFERAHGGEEVSPPVQPTKNGPRRVITCSRGSKKKLMDLTHFKFENRSNTARSLFLQSSALPDEAVELQLS